MFINSQQLVEPPSQCDNNSRLFSDKQQAKEICKNGTNIKYASGKIAQIKIRKYKLSWDAWEDDVVYACRRGRGSSCVA